jgi:hypothetical protein
MKTENIITILVSFIATALTLLGFYMKFVLANKDKIQANKDKVDKKFEEVIAAATATREQVIRMETKIEIFWRNVGFDAAKILHTPHPENARRDFLIIRWETDKIGLAELHELISMLKDIIPDETKEASERKAASDLCRSLEAQYDLASKPMVNIDGSNREIGVEPLPET